MRRYIFALATIFIPLAVAHSGSPSILSPNGLDPLRIGMTEREAEKALGTKLEMSDDASGDADACQEGAISGRSGIYLLTQRHRIERITVTDGTEGIRTSNGVHIGTTESELRKLFDKRATFGPRPYEGDVSGAHEVTVKQNGNVEFVFETEGYKVREMRVGNSPAIQYWEGCA